MKSSLIVTIPQKQLTFNKQELAAYSHYIQEGNSQGSKSESKNTSSPSLFQPGCLHTLQSKKTKCNRSNAKAGT